jgi:hypothetical protein
MKGKMGIGWIWVLLAALALQAIQPHRPGSAAANAVGLPSVNPADPHRFLMDGKPWYPTGYYPGLGALTAEQTDYENYYKVFIDKLVANRINFFRTVFTMGQPYGDSMTIYQRTGPGLANDGKPKFNLNKLNPVYIDYWRDVLEYARDSGIVVHFVINDSWHNKRDVVADKGNGVIWGMLHDFYYGANNINGLDTPTAVEWHSSTHPSYEYHKALIRTAVDNYGDLPNIIYEISNENYTNYTWNSELAEYLTQYEASKGFARHLVMPRDLPNHDTAGGKYMDPVIAHKELAGNYRKNKPLIADNDGGGDRPPDGRRYKAWAALTAGGHISYYHAKTTSLDVLTSQDTSEGMFYLGLLQKFLSDFQVNLTGMKPNDALLTNGWALAVPGDRFIIYLMSGGQTTVSSLPGVYTASWFNPRTGNSSPAGKGPTFTAPDANDWVLYIAKSGVTPPTSQPSATRTPPANPTATLPPPTGQVHVKINFQPASAPVPAGFLKDDGSPYGSRGSGYVYGWNADNCAAARDRNAGLSPGQQYDTLVHMQQNGTFTWEMAVPDGNYQVLLAAGDPSYTNSVYKIAVEGVLAVNGTPTSSSPWKEGTVSVHVTDGRLTVSSASGADNNKINFIQVDTVSQATAPAATATRTPQPSNTAAPTLTRTATQKPPETNTSSPTSTKPAASPTASPLPPTSTPAPATTHTPSPTNPAGLFQVKINFQPGAAPVPPGYLVDGGLAYGDRGNGYTYGWNTDNQANTRDREAANAPNQLIDTFNHMQLNGAFTWDLAAPNGTYSVKIGAGDPSYKDSIYKILVEGVMSVNFEPTKAAYWRDVTVTVTVSDGKLSLTSAPNAVNNKIQFIEVTQLHLP